MISFLKKEPVLTIASIAAVISAFFVKPSKAYADYIDLPVLILLFCLMIVVAGLMETKLFDVISSKILKRSDSSRTVALILVNITFFSAMLITNDVSLITLVPLTIGIFGGDRRKNLIPLVVMETAAANLGSMVMPFGNPQNLYLYSYYNMSIENFVTTVLPFGILSIVLVNIFTFALIKNDKILIPDISDAGIKNRKMFLVYSALFVLCILTVLRVLNVYICLCIVAAVCLITNFRIFAKVDYFLLLTFCSFFVFVGNLGNIGVIKDTLSSLVEKHEFIVGVLLSQVISNVPAAIMLSGFTDNAKELLLGTDIGGLGTLVASLASLISYKQYSRLENADTKKYMLMFTAVNILLLLIMTGAYAVIK